MILQFIPPLNGQPGKPRILRRSHPLAPRIQRTVEVLRTRASMTNAELAEALALAPDTVRDYVSQAVRQGLVGVTFEYGATRYHVRTPLTLAVSPLSPAQHMAVTLTMHLDQLPEATLIALRDAIETHLRVRAQAQEA